jgi:hypothetical protein
MKGTEMTTIRQRYRQRAAVATLELVLCMPILLALAVAIVWLGMAVVGQSEVTVQARHQAWGKRFEQPAGKALNFLSEDIVSGEATGEVNVSPLVDDIAPPESSHDVMADPWDHESLPLERPPHWEQYATAAVNAKTGKVQVAYTDARNQLNALQSQADTLLAQAVQQMLADLIDPADLFRSARSETENQGTARKQELEAELRRRQRAMDVEVRDEIDRLEKRKGEAQDAGEKKLLEELIKVQQNKAKRLEADIEDLRDDVEAIGQ